MQAYCSIYTPPAPSKRKSVQNEKAQVNLFTCIFELQPRTPKASKLHEKGPLRGLN